LNIEITETQPDSGVSYLSVLWLIIAKI